MADSDTAALPRVGLAALFARFLRFGCLAFGGPVAQIAMVRQALVEEEHWISSARFNRLLAVMQVLPGPEAHELCVHLGMVARGRIGGLLAGLGFMLPGLVLMLIAAWAYVAFVADAAGFSPLLLGVQVSVLALIARAVHRIGQHVLTGPVLAGIAVAAFVATLAGVPFWVPLAAAALAGVVPLSRWWPAFLVAVAGMAAWLLMTSATPVLTPTPEPRLSDVSLFALFWAGLKGGLLTFGGAYTAVPYVRADTVGRGWLSDGAFLDGVAVAGMLPAPLVIFATFAGYVAGGLGGALVITLGMFLPAFAFSMIFFERLEGVLDQPRLHTALDQVAAAAVGVIGATIVQLALVLAGRIAPVAALVIFAAASILAWRWKSRWTAPAIVLLGAAAGWVLLR